MHLSLVLNLQSFCLYLKTAGILDSSHLDLHFLSYGTTVMCESSYWLKPCYMVPDHRQEGWDGTYAWCF